MVTVQDNINIFEYTNGSKTIVKTGKHYTIGYLDNDFNFMSNSKLLKGWKHIRTTLKQIDNYDIDTNQYNIVKIESKEKLFEEQYKNQKIFDKIGRRKKFVICPTFISAWIGFYSYRIKPTSKTMVSTEKVIETYPNNITKIVSIQVYKPNKITGKKFLKIYKECIDFIQKYNPRHYPKTTIQRLINNYYEMKKTAYLNGKYPICEKKRLY